MTTRRSFLTLAIAGSLLSGGSALAQNDGRVWSRVPQISTSTRTAVEWSAPRVTYVLQRQLAPYWLSYYSDYYSGYYRDYYSRYYYPYYPNYYPSSYRDTYRQYRDYYTSYYYPGYYDVEPRYRITRSGSNAVVVRRYPAVEYIVVSPRYTPARPPQLRSP